MTPNEYQRLAMSTSVAHADPSLRLVNAILGIVGEVGELAVPFTQERIANAHPLPGAMALIALDGLFFEAIKKYFFHQHPLPDDFLTRTFCVASAASVLPYWAGRLPHSGPTEDLPPFRPVSPVERADLLKELGDILWYVAQACDALGFTLEEVMEANIAKLRQRYPAGFSSEASRTREQE